LGKCRSEAKGVPSLLLANPPPPLKSAQGLRKTQPQAPVVEELCYDDPAEDDIVLDEISEVLSENDDDEDGYYADGAYVAKPDASISVLSSIGTTHSSLSTLVPRAISREWHENLIASFSAMRQQLKDRSSSSIIQRKSLVKYGDWVAALTIKPTMEDLRGMSQTDIIRGLNIFPKLLAKGHDISEEFSQWLYGLLLRCEDVGVMANEEVCVVRDLGKRASFLLGYWATKRAETPDSWSSRDWWNDTNNQPQIENETILTQPTMETPLANNTVFKPRSTVLSTSTRTIIDSDSVSHFLESRETVVEDKETVSQVVEQSTDSISTDACVSTVDKADDDCIDNTSPYIVPAEDLEEQYERLLQQSAGITESVGQKHFKSEKVDEPSLKTLYTLDMVLSIIGDFFGQKDLLLERR